MQFPRHIIGFFLTLPLFAQPDPSLHVGFYHWGGVYPASISEGVDAVAAIGGRIVRLAVSAKMNRDYGIAWDCIPGFTLAGAMQYPDVKKALDHPAISVFMLTAYDGVTFGDCYTHEYLNPRLNTSRQAAIIQEYSDLTLYLYQTYQHTNKQFIISNWESDNDVYCGAADWYSTDNIFRADCDANYPRWYNNGNASPTESFWGLRLWFEARQQGIEDGRNRALAMGIGGRGRKVYLAPEVNICRHLRYGGLKSTLYDVVPYVKFDYVSYSSWESMGVSDPRSTLLEDLETIWSVTGSHAIILGEIRTGYSLADPQGSIQALREVMDDALSWGVSYAIYWDVYDFKDCPSCGLYDDAGRITPVGEFFKDYLDPPAPSTRPLHFRARGIRP
jgi:hypothetical protein